MCINSCMCGQVDLLDRAREEWRRGGLCWSVTGLPSRNVENYLSGILRLHAKLSLTCELSWSYATQNDIYPLNLVYFSCGRVSPRCPLPVSAFAFSLSYTSSLPCTLLILRVPAKGLSNTAQKGKSNQVESVCVLPTVLSELLLRERKRGSS